MLALTDQLAQSIELRLLAFKFGLLLLIKGVHKENAKTIVFHTFNFAFLVIGNQERELFVVAFCLNELSFSKSFQWQTSARLRPRSFAEVIGSVVAVA